MLFNDKKTFEDTNIVSISLLLILIPFVFIVFKFAFPKTFNISFDKIEESLPILTLLFIKIPVLSGLLTHKVSLKRYFKLFEDGNSEIISFNTLLVIEPKLFIQFKKLFEDTNKLLILKHLLILIIIVPELPL